MLISFAAAQDASVLLCQALPPAVQQLLAMRHVDSASAAQDASVLLCQAPPPACWPCAMLISFAAAQDASVLLCQAPPLLCPTAAGHAPC